MALINCPECGKEISDSAKKCINCGYVLKQGNRKTGFVVIAILLVIIVAVVVGVFVWNINKHKNSTKTTTSVNVDAGETSGYVNEKPEGNFDDWSDYDIYKYLLNDSRVIMAIQNDLNEEGYGQIKDLSCDTNSSRINRKKDSGVNFKSFVYMDFIVEVEKSKTSGALYDTVGLSEEICVDPVSGEFNATDVILQGSIYKK